MRSYRLTLGEEFNEGARQLWLLMERRGWDQADVIREIEHATKKNARGLLPRYLYGDQRPGAVWAHRIELAVGVDAGLWGQPPREPFTPPARAAAVAALSAETASADARLSKTGTEG